PFVYFFFNATATTQTYTLSLHDALPISRLRRPAARTPRSHPRCRARRPPPRPRADALSRVRRRAPGLRRPQPAGTPAPHAPSPNRIPALARPLAPALRRGVRALAPGS